jgi:hypothetical protein
MHDLVGQRTPEQRMGMAAHRQCTRRDALPRRIDDELDLPARAGDQMPLRGVDGPLRPS